MKTVNFTTIASFVKPHTLTMPEEYAHLVILNRSEYLVEELEAHYRGEETSCIINKFIGRKCNDPERHFSFFCEDGEYISELCLATLVRRYELIDDLASLDPSLSSVEVPFAQDSVHQALTGCSRRPTGDDTLPVLKFLRPKDVTEFLRAHDARLFNDKELLHHIGRNLDRPTRMRNNQLACYIEDEEIAPIYGYFFRQSWITDLASVFRDYPSILLLCYAEWYVETRRFGACGRLDIIRLIAEDAFFDEYPVQPPRHHLAVLQEAIVSILKGHASFARVSHPLFNTAIVDDSPTHFHRLLSLIGVNHPLLNNMDCNSTMPFGISSDLFRPSPEDIAEILCGDWLKLNEHDYHVLFDDLSLETPGCVEFFRKRTDKMKAEARLTDPERTVYLDEDSQ